MSFVRGISTAEKGKADQTETAGGGEKNDSPLRKSAQDKHHAGADKGVFRRGNENQPQPRNFQKI